MTTTARVQAVSQIKWFNAISAGGLNESYTGTLSFIQTLFFG